MNKIEMTVSLSKEDREWIAALIVALRAQTHDCKTCAEDVSQYLDGLQAPQPAQDEPAQPVAEENAPAEERHTQAPENEPEVKPEPKTTKAELQSLVITLCAKGQDTKTAVREIVNAYAGKVSDIPEDKLDEVAEKLRGLEV